MDYFCLFLLFLVVVIIYFYYLYLFLLSNKVNFFVVTIVLKFVLKPTSQSLYCKQLCHFLSKNYHFCAFNTP